MIVGNRGTSLDTIINFDSKEEPEVQIKLSVDWDQGEQIVMLDIANPFVQELITKKDERLFEMLNDLVRFGLHEIQKAAESEFKELEDVERNLKIKSLAKIRFGKPGYIYLAKAGEGYHKIGRSQNVEVRIREIGLQLPFPVKVLHVIPAKDMYLSERNFHEQYAHCHLNGEWFALTEDDVKTICSITEL